MLRIIASQNGSYVISLFDCSREALQTEMMTRMSEYYSSKTSNDGNSSFNEDFKTNAIDDRVNFISTYVRQQSIEVQTDNNRTSLAASYFNYL